MVTAIVMIFMLAAILVLGGAVLNYFAKEHDVHYVMMEEIIKENNELKARVKELASYANEVEEVNENIRRSNIILYKQIRSMTNDIEKAKIDNQ